MVCGATSAINDCMATPTANIHATNTSVTDPSDALWKKTGHVGELARQIVIDDVVQAPFGKRLLLRADSHSQQLLDGDDPLGVGHYKRVVVQCVLRPLNVSRAKRVGRIL
jgi:hypothetical protein